MPKGIPNSGKRGRKSTDSFELSSLQAELEGYRRRITGPIDRKIAELTSEIEELQAIKASLGGGLAATAPRRGRPPLAKSAGNGSLPHRKSAGRKGKRVRRTRESVEAHAREILDFVKSSKSGVTGSQIKDKFGKVIGTVKNYVKQYTGADLESVGPKTSMRYTVK